jgi:LysM repeat protein
MLRTAATVCFAILATSTTQIHAQTLRGSAGAMNRQYRIAVDHDYTFLSAAGDVNRFVDLGLLLPVKGNANYDIHAVSFPYARPAVRTFVERLSAQYRSACGEKLVVTSLTRPTTRQPRNASDVSVHPAGMAVDLRISNKASCRRWIERTLLSLEKTGVLDATRERNPAHYHIAIFPMQYVAYVDRLVSRGATRLASNAPSGNAAATRTVAAESAVAATDAATVETDVSDLAGSALSESGPDDSGSETTASDASEPSTSSYRVSRGDTLWSIARAHDTTVAEIKSLNGLASSRIRAGQTLTVPAR